MARENTPAQPAPGAKVVEALGNQIAASFTSIAVKEAHDALRTLWTAEGRTPDSTQSLKLSVLDAHAQQLVTATTPVGGGS